MSKPAVVERRHCMNPALRTIPFLMLVVLIRSTSIARQISSNEDVGGWLRPACWHVLTFHAVGEERDGWEPISVEQFAAQMAQLAEIQGFRCCRDPYLRRSGSAVAPSEMCSLGPNQST